MYFYDIKKQRQAKNIIKRGKKDWILVQKLTICSAITISSLRNSFFVVAFCQLQSSVYNGEAR